MSVEDLNYINYLFQYVASLYVEVFRRFSLLPAGCSGDVFYHVPTGNFFFFCRSSTSHRVSLPCDINIVERSSSYLRK